MFVCLVQEFKSSSTRTSYYQRTKISFNSSVPIFDCSPEETINLGPDLPGNSPSGQARKFEFCYEVSRAAHRTPTLLHRRTIRRNSSSLPDRVLKPYEMGWYRSYHGRCPFWYTITFSVTGDTCVDHSVGFDSWHTHLQCWSGSQSPASCFLSTRHLLWSTTKVLSEHTQHGHGQPIL